MLCSSNRVERLLDELVQQLQRPIRGTDAVFEPTHIIAPTPEVEVFLRQGIAARSGLCANLVVDDFGGLLTRCLPTNGALRDRDEAASLALLLELLGAPERLAGEDLMPVRAYLGLEGNRGALDPARRLQLAQRIARLFERYRLDVPELLDTWRADALALDDTPLAQAERWQRALWTALHDPDTGAFARLETADPTTRWIDLTHPNDALILPRAVHVFAVSYLPRAWRRLLSHLATRTALRVFHLAPAIEFIEEVPAPWRRPEMLFQFPSRELRLSDSDDVLGRTEDDPPALRLWGAPGRVQTRLLHQIPGLEPRPCFVDPCEGAPPSLLRQLQRDILLREPERRPPHNALSMPPDDSVRLLECPTIQREVEVVASEIWSMVLGDARDARSPPLRFNDIAVIVNRPERDAYLARIRATFHEAHQIPISLRDLPPAAVSRYLEAVESLLRLPLGEFSRDEVLALVTHPNIAHAGDPVLRRRWCEQLAILRGADRATLAESYVERDLFNWDQGLRRLLLGAFMTRPEDDDAVVLDDEHYLPLELPHDQLGDAARFSLLVRSLIEDARFARRAHMSLARWSRFLIATLGYLRPARDDDERLRAACLDAFSQLARVAAHDQPVDYRVACDLARQALASIEVSRGQHMLSGVAVSSFLPMRPTPFRVVFLLGLGEGRFPEPEPEQPFDLRAACAFSRHVTPRARDQYLFLETLLCTRDRLILSHVARDEHTGEPLAPSPVVDRLVEMLERGYLAPAARGELRAAHPLRRHDPRYFPTLFQSPGSDASPDHADEPLPNHLPEARREAQAAALRAVLIQRGGPLQSLVERGGGVEALRRVLEPEAWRQLSSLLALPRVRPIPPSARLAAARSDGIDLPLRALQRFLASPLQGAASFLLELERDPIAGLPPEHERFELGRAERVVWLRQILLEGLAEEIPARDFDVIARVHDRAAQRRERSGHHPTGVFAEAARTRHLETLAAWHRALAHAELLEFAPFRRVCIGVGEARDDVAATRPPLSIPIALDEGEVEARLHGLTQPLFTAFDASVIFVERTDVRPADLLRGFLDHVVLAASGLRADEPHRIIVVHTTSRARPAPEQHTLAPLSQQAARDYLQRLVRDLLLKSHDHLLPIEAIFRAALDDPPRPVSPEVSRLVNQGRASDLYGPIRDLRPFAPPFDADAIARRRLGLLLDQLPRKK